ncbi:MAG TPA: enoyl-CoA hydratase-related protein [Balneolales bacterium]|nr:enoyl-CoA hydratase-related protein [Balneolales bacterium]
MSYSYITYRATSAIAEIILNRPDKLNSFHRDMAKELQDALNRTEYDPSIRCVLLTGNGRAFSAGQDIREIMEKREDPLGNTVRFSYNPIIRSIRELNKPVIAAVNGTAAGAGANIALACDLVCASEDAVFIQSFCHLGLIPDSGGTYFIPRLVGLQRAFGMMMLGEKISAKEAESIGLIYKTFSGDRLMEEVRKIAGRLADLPTKGLALTKRALNQSITNELSNQLEVEAELQTEAGKTDDYQEGLSAFIEKREPHFTGK